jgi:RNA polymerase-binding transcription factor DksA
MADAPPGPRSDLDLAHFRQLLEAERARVSDQIARLHAQDETGGVAGELSELADYDQHAADQATELLFREQDQAINEGLQDEMDQIEAAMKRLADGVYGYCARCGTLIPAERLEIMPAAIYCVGCARDVAQAS